MADAKGAKIIPARSIHWALILLTLVVLAAGTAILTFHLRGVIRERIVEQHGEVLYAAAGIVREFAGEDESLLELPREEIAYLFAQLRGIRPVAMRLFDAAGTQLLHFPDQVRSESISEDDLGQLRQLSPVSRYRREMALGEIFSPEAEHLPLDTTAPLVTAYIPLDHEGEFIGAAGFVVDGQHIAEAMSALNRDLLLYGCLIFFIGGGLVATGLAWAFRRLELSNQLLIERGESLSRANRQLALAAKTSAIGAVTAHLIHDLKNPLFGLEHFVSGRGENGGGTSEDWALALDTTRRMQRMISDVVRILQEEKGDASYELTLEELGAALQAKLGEGCAEAGLELQIQTGASGTLSNKDANLILLIATNLARNAMQATPPGGVISFRSRETADDYIFEISDTGPGLPPNLLKNLFAPCRSGKQGGTGLGLAISKQLASHMGADLSLAATSPSGTTFELRVSKEILAIENSDELVLQ